ncbi:MAG: hypothetical protein K0R39_1947 [Symbiobacteriaceae bacterium]|jgi:predicted secreted protein|nr:hypothetical protein [Symbiobacteriaceae bacterium]
MKRFLIALCVAALLAILALPAMAGQRKPGDPAAFLETSSSLRVSK